MTDEALLRKKLAFILRCVEELRVEAKLDRIETDVREQRFVVHTLQIAIQAALDVAFHVISDEGLGEPTSNRDAFERLGRHGVIGAGIRASLERMAGFRNVVVHGYQDLDIDIVRDVVGEHLDDLVTFVRDVDRWLADAGT